MRGCYGRSDQTHHAVKIAENVVVPKPHHPIAAAFEKCGSPRVARTLSVLTTVSLDDQSPFLTDEVGDEWSNRLLPPELGALYL